MAPRMSQDCCSRLQEAFGLPAAWFRLLAVSPPILALLAMKHKETFPEHETAFCFQVAPQNGAILEPLA